MTLQKAIFLDRDGVIIENCAEYVRSWSDVAFLPGAIEAVRRLTESGWAVVIVTNQAVVGRGIVPEPEIRAIHERVVAEIAAGGGRITASYLCVHAPSDGCRCRKPLPGMLLDAAADHNLDLSSSFMIGDALTDIQAGQRAGARSIMVLTGRGSAQQADTGLAPFEIVDDLAAAVDRVLNY